MTTPETMTKHDFSDLTPPVELVAEWTKPRRQGFSLAQDIAHRAARWGAEQAAERLKGQWPEPITDRRPTEADAFVGKVQYFGGSYWHVEEWDTVAAHEWPWAHSPRWQPPAPPTLKEQALALLEPEGTPARVLNEDQLSLIRCALEADS